jgi:hypothetical protein
MNVACFFAQHSVRFGQRASSHTVATPLSATISFVRANVPPPGIGRFNHGGNRRPGRAIAEPAAAPPEPLAGLPLA